MANAENENICFFLQYFAFAENDENFEFLFSLKLSTIRGPFSHQKQTLTNLFWIFEWLASPSQALL